MHATVMTTKLTIHAATVVTCVGRHGNMNAQVNERTNGRGKGESRKGAGKGKEGEERRGREQEGKEGAERREKEGNGDQAKGRRMHVQTAKHINKPYEVSFMVLWDKLLKFGPSSRFKQI